MVVAFAVAVAGAACSGGSPDEPASRPTTTSVAAATSTPSYVEPKFVDAPQDYTSSGDYDTGHHVGGIEAIDVDARTVEVDFIQFLSGEEAITAYRADTGEADTPPNDYWVRNENKQRRTYRVALDAPITVNTLGSHGPDQNELVDLAKFAELLSGTRGDADYVLPLGITIKDRVVTRIEQLYVP